MIHENKNTRPHETSSSGRVHQIQASTTCLERGHNIKWNDPYYREKNE